MSTSRRFGLFEALGVELEYMIVDAGTLDVAAIADELFRAAAGSYVGEVDLGAISWSNELVAHVVELKTSQPAAALAGLAQAFAEHVRRINDLLRPLGARLMPSGMHPWMDPARETRLWPHDCSEVYANFDRVFGCRGHGWSNLQAVHLNLPFAGDEQFGRLHAAIRLLLPILPALAASSPIVERRTTGMLDTRLDVYGANSNQVPSVGGRVIPEPAFTEEDYRRTILERIYADIAPHDPEGTLRHEWLNARGAIARFDRGTIEIRVLDVQECPAADVAICAAIVAVLRALVEERWTSWADQKAWTIERLAPIFQSTVRDGEQATISDVAYLKALGCDAGPKGSPAGPQTAGQLWRRLLERTAALESIGDAQVKQALRVLIEHGSLARRILQALGADGGHAAAPDISHHGQLKHVYARLCDCLSRGEMFMP